MVGGGVVWTLEPFVADRAGETGVTGVVKSDGMLMFGGAAWWRWRCVVDGFKIRCCVAR